MSPEQRKRFYFKECWTPLSTALDWRMESGRLVGDLNEQLTLSRRWPDHAAKLFNDIVTKALELAAQEHIAVDAETLRHACNFVASAHGGASGSQRTTSSKELRQNQVNHFARLCALLRDPWDFNAAHAWLNPDEDDLKRYIAFVEGASFEAAFIAVAGNKYPHRHWKDLTLPELNNCYREVTGRPPQKRYLQRA